MTAIKLTYNDVDITGSVDILRCWHEMNAENTADTLELLVDDTNNLWDKWKPQKGDKISLIAGNVKSGIMYLNETYQDNARFVLNASTLPTGAKQRKSKAWQDVRLLQMGEEIANKHGLRFISYGINDVKFAYKLQNNEHDFRFLSRICMLEGCAFLIYDETLVMYSENAMESKEPTDVINLIDDSKFRLFDNSDSLYGSCKVLKGDYKGAYKNKSGLSSVYIPDMQFNVSGNAEANRYAKNLLRHVNKGAYTGYIRYDEILKSNVPGAVFDLQSDKVPSWNGPVFITKVRNNYISDKSKVFFRRTLGGEY